MSSSRKIAKIEGYEDEDMKNIIKCLEKQGFLVSEYDELDDDYKIWNILKQRKKSDESLISRGEDMEVQYERF